MGQQQNEATGHWRKYITSDTLQAVDLQGAPRVVVIERVVQASIADHDDPKIKKGVLNVYFKGKKKPLVCKAEKAGIISKIVGSTTCQDWKGHAIEIFPTTIFAYGEKHDYIDISPRKPTAASAKTAAAAPAEPEPPPSDFQHEEIREGVVPSDQEQREILAREAAEANRG